MFRERPFIFIASDFVPETGGLAQFVYQLLRHLPPGQVGAVATPIPGWQSFDNKQSFPIWRLSIPERWYPFNRQLKFLSPLYLTQLMRIRPKPRMVVCGHGSHALLLTAWLYRLIFSVPYGVMLHGYDILSVPDKWYRSYYEVLLRSANRIYPNSQMTADAASAADVDPARICRLSPCVDEQAWASQANEAMSRSELGLSSGRCVLTVARLVERKGVQRVIQAMAHVQATVPDVQHVIVGDGPYRVELERMASRLEVQATFVGRQAHSRMGAYYAACDVFAMVNDVESFGIVFLEANLSGKPVVAPQLPGVANAVVDRETGILVDPQDIEAIAEAILRLLQDKELARQLGENGRQRVLQKFTGKVVAEKFLSCVPGAER